MVSEHSKLGFTILGSGSSGNATVIHCPGGNVLLDAGFSANSVSVWTGAGSRRTALKRY